MSMRHSTIQMDTDTVTKTAAPETMRVEVEKTIRAIKIAEDCGLFRVPRILDYDRDKGKVVFERMPGLRGIRPSIAFGNPDYRIVDNLARSLAIVHRKLWLPDEMIVPLPPEYRHAGSEVFFHGDVSVENVCIGEGTPSLIILDWQTTPLHGGRATFGSRYFDLSWFLLNLFCLPSARFIWSDPVTSVANRFVSVYAEESGAGFQEREFASYLKRFFEVELPQVRSYTHWRMCLMLPLSRLILNKFVRSRGTGAPHEIDRTVQNGRPRDAEEERQ